MKVYLAAQYGWRDELKEYAKKLEAIGIEVTSSWLNERKDPKVELHDLNERFLREHALQDIDDILDADAIVLFTVDCVTPTKRGGRHVEFGYAMAQGLDCILCGPRENIFHYLGKVKQFNTFDEVVMYLITRKHDEQNT